MQRQSTRIGIHPSLEPYFASEKHLYTWVTKNNSLIVNLAKLWFIEVSDPSTEADIIVDASKTFQTIFGFGGAFTDAAGISMHPLSEKCRQNLLRSYFHAESGKLILVRIIIITLIICRNRIYRGSRSNRKLWLFDARIQLLWSGRRFWIKDFCTSTGRSGFQGTYK